MAIPVQCDVCGHRYKIQDRFAGEELPCKHCGDYFSVPDPEVNRGRKKPRGRGERSAKEKEDAARKNAYIAAGTVAAVLLGCGVFLVISFGKRDDPAPNVPAPAGNPNAPIQARNESAFQPGVGFDLKRVTLPNFPARLPQPIVHASGAKIYEIDLAAVPGNMDAGQQMKMRLYLPEGEHQDSSLGCVLVPPAGSTLLTGMPLDDAEYFDETLPYVDAGFAVVHYSLDGPLADIDNANRLQLGRAYRKFQTACAGIVNGRNALEFVLARVPQVDRNRIYSAGHSSAGTLSLLFAEHEPRLAGCIAYAPAADLETSMADLIGDPEVAPFLPNLREFLRESSPMTHVSKFQCPVFLFHAADDSNTPIATTHAFYTRVRNADKQAVLKTTPFGDHYESMIDRGIPWGIDWLKTLPTEPGN